MIFAAGIGSRLKPWTDSHPKALAPLAGMPMLGHVIAKLRQAGVTCIVVNVHHFASQVREYLATAPVCQGLDIEVSDESDLLLDTGGGLLAARHLLDDGSNEPILLHNADIYTDFSPLEMLGAHLHTSSDVTLFASPRSSSRQLYFHPSTLSLLGWQNLSTGATLPPGFDPTHEVSLPHEAGLPTVASLPTEAALPTGAALPTETGLPTCAGPIPLAFGGVHIVSPSIFPHLETYSRSSGPVFSIVPFYLSQLSDHSSSSPLRITAFIPASPFRWHDIGTPAKLAAAEAQLLYTPEQ